MKCGRMNVLPDYNPWQMNTKTPTTLNFRNRKIPRSNRNNAIMPWGQKHLFLKKKIGLRPCFSRSKHFRLLFQDSSLIG